MAVRGGIVKYLSASWRLAKRPSLAFVTVCVCCASFLFADGPALAQSEQERKLLLDSLTNSLPTVREPTPEAKAVTGAKVEGEAAPLATQQPADQGPSQFSKPVQELMQYLADLRSGAVAFSWRKGMTGDEAARQLGYTRLFAGSYEELILNTKERIAKRGSVALADVIADYEGIVREEQAIDQLMSQNRQFRSSIAFLRALQNGDVVFPGPQAFAPVPELLLVQLMAAYPKETFDLHDRGFASAYRSTREFASTRLETIGEVRAYEVIAEFRRSVLRSAEKPATPTPCEKGEVVGVLKSITEICTKLNLSQSVLASVDGSQANVGIDQCMNTSSATFKQQVSTLGGDARRNFCDQMVSQTRSGKMNAFVIQD